jgi:hypothetical protein
MIKRIAFLLVVAAAAASDVVSLAHATGQADEAASPIYGVTIPPGYRDWKMIAVAQLKTDKVDQLRAQRRSRSRPTRQGRGRSLTGQS